MHDELVKRLREFASIPEHCENVADCDKCTKEEICLSFTNKRIIEVTTQAADAIEELSVVVRAQKAVLDKFPRWIPVTERLPEEDGCYLVAVKNDHKRRYSKTAWFSHDSWFARQDVTHWMPLPQPPKEE